jgi:protein-L-isoaspartate(D-aspartate) O-methyltransferase
LRLSDAQPSIRARPLRGRWRSLGSPPAWSEVLAPGGRLGVVVRTGPVGHAELYLRSDHDIGRRDLFDCAAPIMAGFESQAAFTF